MDEFAIRFEGKALVIARQGDLEIRTDQPSEFGGDGTAASPFVLFLASIGTCAGFYVRRFCESRGISIEGIRLVQHILEDPTDSRKIGTVRVEVILPHSFPDQYRDAVIRAAETCAVKKYLRQPFRVETVAISPSDSAATRA